MLQLVNCSPFLFLALVFKGKIGPLWCSQKNYLHILIWQRTAQLSGPFWLFLLHMGCAGNTGWTFKQQLNPNNHESISCFALLRCCIYYKPSPHSAAERSLAVPRVSEPDPLRHGSFGFAGILIWNVVLSPREVSPAPSWGRGGCEQSHQPLRRHPDLPRTELSTSWADS